MFKNLTTVRRVAWGFGVLTIVLVCSVLLTIWQVSRTRDVTNKLLQKYTPISESSLRVLNGVNHSLASLRGYMLLNNEQAAIEASAAWKKRINPAIKELMSLTEVPESVEAIAEKYDIAALERRQLAATGQQDERLSLNEKVALVAVKLSELRKI